MYRLTVDKCEESEAYQKAMQGWSERRQWSDGGVRPEPRYEKCLMVDLTDEEFAAVKKAVLGVM